VEDQDKNIFYFSRDWRNFINTRKDEFSRWKKAHQLIRLKFPIAESFYHSMKLQRKFLRWIENPREQLELYINRNDGYLESNKIIDLQLIHAVKRIDVRETKIVPCSVVNVTDVEIVNCTFDTFSFSMFSNVSRLSFHDYHTDNAYDFAMLKHLKNGDFYIHYCVHYHCLSHLPSLQIINCYSVSDVSCSKDIRVLTLSSCCNITDVSSLGGIFQVDLSFNSGIVDVSNLGNVRTLRLSGCTGITDVSALNNVHTLDLSHCNQISDISELTSVVVLDISGCRNIDSVAMLACLKELNIRGCEKVHDLVDLVHLQKLIVDGVQQFPASNFPVISHLRHFAIYDNYMHDYIATSGATSTMSVERVSFFTKIPALRFDHDGTLVNLPSFPHLISLTILACFNFTGQIPYLPALEHLEILHCPKVESFDLLGGSVSHGTIYYLKIVLCVRLKRVSIWRNVFRCHITNCEKFHLVEVHKQTDSLLVRHCRESCRVVCKALIGCISFFGGSSIYLNNVTKDVLLSSKKNDAIVGWTAVASKCLPFALIEITI
jgi:hypothetical protein